jgi:hypothetical protein
MPQSDNDEIKEDDMGRIYRRHGEIRNFEHFGW